MKTLGSLSSHYNSGSLTTCDCWLVVRRDGVSLGFTDHPEDLTIDSVLYEGNAGFDRTATEVTDDLSPDNHDLVGIIDSSRVTVEDIQGRKYEGAVVYHFSVDYTNPTGSKDPHGYGYVGSITLSGKIWKAEFSSLSVMLENEICEIRTPYCRVPLGSERCGITLQPGVWASVATVAVGGVVRASSYDGRRYAATVAGVTGASEPTFTSSTTVDGTVTWQAVEALVKAFEVVSVISERNTFIASVLGSVTDGWYQFGDCVFSAGNNSDWPMQVKRHSIVSAGHELEMLFDYPFVVSTGDTGTLTVGCNHKLKDAGDVAGAPYTGHCRARFNNAVHFQGDPESVGIDALLSGDTR